MTAKNIKQGAEGGGRRKGQEPQKAGAVDDSREEKGRTQEDETRLTLKWSQEHYDGRSCQDGLNVWFNGQQDGAVTPLLERTT